MLIGFCMLLFVCRWVALPHHGGPCGALHRCSQLLEWGDDGACCERNHRSLAAIHPRPAGRAGQRSLLVYAQTPTSLSKVFMPLIEDNLFRHYFYFCFLLMCMVQVVDSPTSTAHQHCAFIKGQYVTVMEKGISAMSFHPTVISSL